jgi:hypothetical protein
MVGEDPWLNAHELSLDTAYHSFDGEVEARTPPRYAHLTNSRRHHSSKPTDPGDNFFLMLIGRLYGLKNCDKESKSSIKLLILLVSAMGFEPMTS